MCKPISGQDRGTRNLIISYADYYPFGEQLDGRNSNSANYRYAFQGQELDSETGKEAFQLRLWDGRIGRWLSPDPYWQYASPYLGMGNNPINGVDPDGGWRTKAGAWWHSLWNGGEVFQSKEKGDWGVRNVTADGDEISDGITISTTFGGRRFDKANGDFDLNFGGAGAGGMSLFGNETDISNLKKIKIFEYVGNHKGVDEYESILAFNGAFTPGPFVVYPVGGSKLKYYNVHEPGHVLQYRDLGLINYYRKVAIPSLIYATFHTPKEASRYHTETQANRLWWMETGESDEINNPFSAVPIPNLNIK